MGPVQTQTGFRRSVEKKKLSAEFPKPPFTYASQAIQQFNHFWLYCLNNHLQLDNTCRQNLLGFLAEKNTDHGSEATLHC